MFTNIAKTEWLKVKHYRAFWVLTALFILASFGINYGFVQILDAVRKKTSGLVNLGIYDFPGVWQTVTYFGSLVILLLGFLMIILVSNEFTFRTHRQNIIDGWSRQQFVLSKIWWIVLLSVFATLVTFLVGVVFAVTYGIFGFTLQQGYYLGYAFLSSLQALTLACLLAVLLKRAGMAIVIFLAYMSMENLFVFLINTYVGRFGRLLPTESVDNLIGKPVVEGMVMDKDAYPHAVYLVAGMVWLALGIFFINRRLSRTDL